MYVILRTVVRLVATVGRRDEIGRCVWESREFVSRERIVIEKIVVGAGCGLI